MSPNFHRALLALTVATVLGGCASAGRRADDADINALLAARGGPEVAWSAAAQPQAEQKALEQWLSEPMTAEAAVQVAMLRSPRMRHEYARLGLARAEVLEAVQVANPTLSLSRQSLDPGAGSNNLVGITVPLADLLVLPARRRLAAAEFDRATLEIAAAVLGVTADVEAAWYRYVGARQVADLRAAVADGGDASAELAQRFHDAGNISELQLKLEQAAASEARIAAGRARAEAARARMQLNTLVGLSGDQAQWETADRLPLPVAVEDDPAQLLELARSSSLELLAARQQALILADALGITRKLRWIGGSEIGYERENEAGGSRLRGPTLDLELPIFNQGQAKVARAEALWAEAQARVALAELDVDGAIGLGSQEVRELAKVAAIHRELLIPQREKVVERSQQEQNFMLIGVFELIQAKVKEYDAYQGYLEAVRDYWLARVELMRAVGQRLPSDRQAQDRTPNVEDILGNPSDAAMPAMDHSGHHMPAAPATDHSGHQMPAVPAPVDHSRHAPPADEPDKNDDAPHEDHGTHGETP